MTRTRRKRRLAIVVSHPIQYYVPLYRELARDPEIEVKVFYFSNSSIRGEFDPGFGENVTWNIDLLSGYDHEFVGKHYATNSVGSFRSTLVPAIVPKLLFGRFDALLVNGYAQAGNLLAVAAALLTGTKVLTRSDSNIELVGRSPRLAKKLFVKAFFAVCHAALSSGQRNHAFYRYWGMPDRKLIATPFTVDNDRFRQDSQLSPEARHALRAVWGCHDDTVPVMVFASKFMRRKQPHLTIEAAGRLAREGHRLHLVMAGSGEMDAELRALAATYPELAVHFTGFVNQAEMPALLGASDVFLFPSTGEPWGLIVNEAMAAGLPVVVGERCGCAPDLVEPGVNGSLVGDGDLDALTDAMRHLAIDPALRRRMGDAGSARIARWGLRETREGVREAIGLERKAP